MLTSGKNVFFSAVLIGLAAFFAPGHAFSGAPPSGRTAEPVPERCQITAPARGECKALLEVYSFNPETNACEASNYGGCGGTIPFSTREECKRACETGEHLRLTRVRVEKNLPYFQISIEYPTKWKDPHFSVIIDGKPAKTRWTGGGYSGAVSMSSFAVFAENSGVKTILIRTTVNGIEHHVTKKHYVQAPEMAVLLDHTGDHEAVFSNEPLRFYLHQAVNPIIQINEKPVEMRDLRTVRGTIVTVTPAWQPGRNTMILKATGNSGQTIRKEFSFVYWPDAHRSVTPPEQQISPAVSPDFMSYSNLRIQAGEHFSIPYGAAGSRSGPFYAVGSTNPLLLKVQEKNPLKTVVYTLDNNDEEITIEGISLWEITGLQPGTATLDFSVKKHFLGAYELEKTLKITVTPKP